MTNYFLLVILPNLSCFFTLSMIVSILCSLVAFAISTNEYDENKKSFLSLSKKSLFVFIISSFIAIIMPSKEDVMALTAINIIKNGNGYEEIPENAIKALNNLLKSYIKEEKQ